MAELLFGSVPQLWSTVPVPAFGYLHGPMPPGGNRALSAASPGMMGPQAAPFAGGATAGVPVPNRLPDGAFGFGVGLVPASTPNMGAGWSAVPSNPIGEGLQWSMGSEVAVGVSAQSLLAAVALRRGQPLGPTNDQEVEDFICDALDLVPGANDVEVRCEGGRATLSGAVPHKRFKRDVGEIAWAIPSVTDVQNNVTIAVRRRSRAPNRESDTPPTVASRKQA